MAIPVSSRPAGKRYLGNANRSKMEVHDLLNEERRCQIDDILKAGHAVAFQPDSLAQAHAEGHDNCAWCLGGSQR